MSRQALTLEQARRSRLSAKTDTTIGDQEIARVLGVPRSLMSDERGLTDAVAAHFAPRLVGRRDSIGPQTYSGLIVEYLQSITDPGYRKHLAEAIIGVMKRLRDEKAHAEAVEAEREQAQHNAQLRQMQSSPAKEAHSGQMRRDSETARSTLEQARSSRQWRQDGSSPVTLSEAHEARRRAAARVGQ